VTTKLTICNGAQRVLKERHLTQAELTANNREPARLFNAVWDDGGVNGALEAGQWRFAKRTLMIDSNPSITTDFGFRNVFDKPDDFVRTIGVWRDERMSDPLMDYREEAGLWYSDTDPIYVSYVSNDADYGLDYSKWPQTFVHFVHAHFAALIAGPLTDQGKEAWAVREVFLKQALAIDGMADPTRRLPTGSWVASRVGGRGGREFW
jgi:hypothetical protein